MEPHGCVERQVRDLLPGDHAWLAYSSTAEWRHITGAFVRNGLAPGDRVIYLTDLPRAEIPGLTAFVPRDRLVTIPVEAAFRHDGAWDPDQMIATLGTEITEAQRAGCRTVRVVADLTAALAEPDGFELLMAAERRCAAMITGGGTVVVLCLIDRRRCTPEQYLALHEPHTVLTAPDPEHEDGVLRITRTFDPPGLSLGGELDASRHIVFGEVLTRLVATEKSLALHLDLADLAFIDLGALNILADVAMSRCDQGPMVLDNLAPQLRSVMEDVGWHMLPGIWIPGARY